MRAIILSGCLILVGCGLESGPPHTCDDDIPVPDLCSSYDVDNIRGRYDAGKTVFDSTIVISVPPYDYYDQQLFVCSGDSFYGYLNVNTVDWLSSRPTLKWPKTGDQLMAAAIFENRVRVAIGGQRIVNVDDVVWAWHSGLSTGSEHENSIVLEWADGRKVVNGMVVEDEVPSPLLNNKGYVWCAWAWNEQGTKVTKSTREHPFIVGQKDNASSQLISRQQVYGGWTVATAIDSISGSSVSLPFQDIYFVYYCDSDINEYTSYYGDSISDGLWEISDNRLFLRYPINLEFYDVELQCDQLTAYTILPTGRPAFVRLFR